MKKLLFLTLVFIGAIAIVVKANPLDFPAPVQYATATSTMATVATSTATTTITLDAYAAAQGGKTSAFDGATFLLQSISSSTASVINVRFQYSRDGIDWYDDYVNGVKTYSTSTASYNLNSPIFFTFTAIGTSRVNRAVTINTPTRFVRANLNATGATSTIWMELVPTRQR